VDPSRSVNIDGASDWQRAEARVASATAAMPRKGA
jgi:hypothetical protein